MENIKARYGIKIILENVSTISLDTKPGDFEYDYYAEIHAAENYRGNGYDNLMIYTNGELKELIYSTWTVSPIIKMPFDWSGYGSRITTKDKDAVIKELRCPYTLNLSSYKRDGANTIAFDITCIFKFLNELDQYYNHTHYQLSLDLKEFLNKYSSINTPNISVETAEKIYTEAKNLTKKIELLIKNPDLTNKQIAFLQDQVESFQRVYSKIPPIDVGFERIEELFKTFTEDK